MKKTVIIISVVAVIVVLGFVYYFFFFPKNNPVPNIEAGGGGALPTSTSTSIPPSLGTSSASGSVVSISDYVGTAAQIFGSVPTSTTLAIGTTRGTVTVNNFYTTSTPVNESGDLIIKQTPEYLVTYTPSNGSFWLAITGTPFSTWQSAAEKDILVILGINETDACKLNITSGVIYNPGDQNNSKSFPLSFCASSTFSQ